MTESSNRCWPGYEPVKGKEQHEQGSCKPKAKSKLKGNEKKFRTKRATQLEAWKQKHPGSPAKAAQHLHKPGGTVKKKGTVTKKRAAIKKTSAK